MTPLAESLGEAVAFSYRSMDRLILNAYIPTLQTPGAMAAFFRHVQKKPIPAGAVFKAFTDRWVQGVQRFATTNGLLIHKTPARTRPGAVAQGLLRSAERAGRYGVVAILSNREVARIFCSRNLGGKPTRFQIAEERRLVNHYYFYFRDALYGDGFIRISSYPPFQTRIWMNAHGYLAGELARRGLGFRMADNCVVAVDDPAALQKIADGFDAAQVETIARRWLAQVPDPLTPEERAANYPTHLSIFQAEFSDNLVFHRTQTLNRVYEPLLRDHLHLGRLDCLKVTFDRQIRGNGPAPCQTRILRQGTVSCLKIFFKHSWLKQYNKDGRVLRTEVCVNNPNDFGVKKSLVHLEHLGRIANHAITRFSKAQTAVSAAGLQRSTFERLIAPVQRDGLRVAAIRFGAPRAMRLLEALGCAGLLLRAFSNAELRQVLVERLGGSAEEFTAGRVRYELAKLRGHGLVRKVKGRHRYTLTDLGYRAAVYFTKAHQRLLTPALDRFDAALGGAGSEAPHALDRALARLNQEFDAVAQLCGLKLAG